MRKLKVNLGRIMNPIIENLFLNHVNLRLSSSLSSFQFSMIPSAYTIAIINLVKFPGVERIVIDGFSPIIFEGFFDEGNPYKNLVELDIDDVKVNSIEISQEPWHLPNLKILKLTSSLEKVDKVKNVYLIFKQILIIVHHD